MVPQNNRRACLCWWEAFAPRLGQLLRFDPLSLSVGLVRNICMGGPALAAAPHGLRHRLAVGGGSSAGGPSRRLLSRAGWLCTPAAPQALRHGQHRTAALRGGRRAQCCAQPCSTVPRSYGWPRRRAESELTRFPAPNCEGWLESFPSGLAELAASEGSRSSPRWRVGGEGPPRLPTAGPSGSLLPRGRQARGPLCKSVALVLGRKA